MKTRWIKQTTECAKTLKVEMPWARGSRRRAMIARREARLAALKSLTA